ncbi:MAG: hypothetical protein ACLRUN_14555, partial [Christensenellales bacterium]
KHALESGAGLAKLKEMIAAQGGDAGVCDDVTRLPQAKHLVPVPAPHDGYVADMDTTAIGYCAQDLGAGRKQKTDVIDPAVGLVMNVRIGDFVKQGDALATLHLNKPEQAERAIARMQQAVKLTADKPAIPPLKICVGFAGRGCKGHVTGRCPMLHQKSEVHGFPTIMLRRYSLLFRERGEYLLQSSLFIQA